MKLKTGKKLPILLVLIFLLAQLIGGVPLQPAAAEDGGTIPGPGVILVPDRTVVQPGEEFMVNIFIANINDLYGASIDLLFDPGLVEVVEIPAGEEEVTAVQPGGIFAQLPQANPVNEVDNQTGILSFALTLTGEIPGVDIGEPGQLLGSIQFIAIDPGTIPFDFDLVFPGKTEPDWGKTLLVKLSDSTAHPIYFGANDIAVNITVPVDKTELAAKIAGAETVLAAATVGNDPGQYPQTAAATLEAAIDAAQGVYDNTAATQAMVDDAVIALNNGIADFEAAEIPVPSTEPTIKGYASWLKANDDSGITVTAKTGTVTAATTTTDIDGLFELRLADGMYDLEIFKTGYVKRTISGVEIAGSLVVMAGIDNKINLIPGDVNGDTLININDLQAVLSAYNSVQGVANFNPNVDFNGDTFININDLQSVLSNYNKTSNNYPAWTWN